MMWWNYEGWGVGGWLAMSLMMLLFWGAVISLVVWLMRSGRSTPWTDEHRQTTDRAEELLAERFARGEIDEAQFNRNRTLLRTRSGRS